MLSLSPTMAFLFCQGAETTEYNALNPKGELEPPRRQGEFQMVETETVRLIRQAKRGDRDAWSRVLERYYDRWLKKYHQDLGSTVHNLYDTEDLVQSAIGDALSDIPQLKNEAAFFAWVTSIIRHKVAQRRREIEREGRKLPEGQLGQQVPDGAGGRSVDAEDAVERFDNYIATLEAMLKLYPEHPEPIAAVNLMFLEGCDIHELVDRLGGSRSTVYRWLQTGVELLKARLKP